MDFNTFAAKVRQAKKVKAFEGILLALDPGETTGWSLWQCRDSLDDIMIDCGQLKTWPMNDCANNFYALLQNYQPSMIVYEQYRVYDWKSDDHKWSDVPTLRIIGSMETQLIQHNIPYTYQTAQVAKNFVTDQRLKDLGLWQKGQRHARDAIRHAVYFLCFGVTTKTSE